MAKKKKFSEFSHEALCQDRPEPMGDGSTGEEESSEQSEE